MHLHLLWALGQMKATLPSVQEKKTVPPGRRVSKNIVSEADADAPTLSEQTYQALVHMIMAKELAAGQVLEERPLSKRLNVSRTPLRMALSRLLGEGIVVRLSNGFYAVNAPNLEDYLHLIQLRRLLEGEAAGRAAENIGAETTAAMRSRVTDAAARAGSITPEEQWKLDDFLHESIADASGNPWLAHMIRDVRRRVRMCNVRLQPGRFPKTCDAHLEIIEALEQRDAERARKAMDAHLNAVWEGFVTMLGVPRANL